MADSISAPISDEEDARSTTYEQRTETKLTGSFIKLIARMIKAILIADSTKEGNVLYHEIVAIVDALKPSIDSKSLPALIREGFELGIEQAGLEQDAELPELTEELLAELLEPVLEYRDFLFELTESTKDSIKALEPSDSLSMEAITALKALESKAKRLASTVAGNAQAQGVIESAKANGLKLLWVNERDACLHCLAYAGLVTEPGEPFGDHTFSTKPLDIEGLVLEHPQGIVAGPPLHPHCRCRLRVWDGPDPRDPEDIPRSNNDVTFAEALQREARRAVLRGSSNYDSLPTRMAAAERLLDLGANLPVSVERRARLALAKGAFRK